VVCAPRFSAGGRWRGVIRGPNRANPGKWRRSMRDAADRLARVSKAAQGAGTGRGVGPEPRKFDRGKVRERFGALFLGHKITPSERGLRSSGGVGPPPFIPRRGSGPGRSRAGDHRWLSRSAGRNRPVKPGLPPVLRDVRQRSCPPRARKTAGRCHGPTHARLIARNGASSEHRPAGYAQSLSAVPRFATHRWLLAMWRGSTLLPWAAISRAVVCGVTPCSANAASQRDTGHQTGQGRINAERAAVLHCLCAPAPARLQQPTAGQQELPVKKNPRMKNG